MSPRSTKPKTTPRPRGSRRTLHTLAELLATLRRPPSVTSISPSYQNVRQLCILEATQRHFKMHPKHPAPLMGKTLLDVGCGTAPMGSLLALAGAEVTAIEPNRQALELAKAEAEAFGTPHEFLPLKVEQLLTDGRRYDVILALDVLEEQHSAGKMVWILGQLLQPGGLLVLGHTTRTLRAWLFHVFFSHILHRRVPSNGRGWRSFHTPEQLTDRAHAAGLQALGADWLRYSVNGRKWKKTQNRHLFTRYLAYYTR